MLRLLICALIVCFSSVQLAIGQVVPDSTQIPEPLADCTVLYFQSRQCQPCRQFEPTLAQLHQKGWDIRQVEAPEQIELARTYEIKNLPTLVLLSNGREVDRVVGVSSAQQLHQRLARLTARSRSAAGHRSEPMVASSVNPEPTSQAAPNPSQTMVVRGQSPLALASGFPLLASSGLTQRSHSSDIPPNSTISKHDTGSHSVQGNEPALTGNDLQAAVTRATHATVRIKTQQDNTSGHGTGTIVALHGPEALVLTCGHLFRDMQPGAKLTVDLFAGTPRQTTVLGQLLDFQAKDQDIAILSLELPVAIQPVEILPQGQSLKIGQPVFSLGCDHGNDPTRRDSQITHVNRYLGAANIEIAGAPAVGRSGGGLFDHQGRLIGVCNAACSQDDEGIYAGADVIYQQLARAGQAQLFSRSTATSDSAPVTLASRSSDDEQGAVQSLAASPQRPAQDRVQWPDENPVLETPKAPKQEQAAEASSRTQIICIVRDPGQSDRVVTITQPSIALLQSIQQQAGR
jgi:thiol-disulfide isomerase/thioredoxin